MNKCLRELRQSIGLTQDELADRVSRVLNKSLDRSTISKIENGGRCSMAMAFAIAKVLGVPVEIVFPASTVLPDEQAATSELSA